MRQSRFWNGKAFRNSPRATMISARRTTFAVKAPGESPRASLLPSDSGIATPTMNRNAGNTRSVGVNPCQGACRRGG